MFRAGRLLSLLSGGMIAILGLLTIRNPAFNPSEVISGGWLFNTLLIGYALPAIIAGIYALLLRWGTEPLMARITGAVALALGFFWISLTIRHGFNPDNAVLRFPIQNAEMWTYSAAWLGIGVALLAAGLLIQQRDLRLASAAFVILAVAKVFLLDMSGLEGVWRAASFIGLGLILMGIGLAYARLGLSGEDQQ